jgi:hypothetical protein
MLKSALFTVMLVAAPAFAQEGARTDFATLQKLATQAAKLLDRQPGELTLAIAQVNVTDELAQALRAERARPTAPRLKAAH